VEKSEFPHTLHEAIKHLSNDDHALNFMRSIRWPDGVVKCPPMWFNRSFLFVQKEDLEVQGKTRKAAVFGKGRDGVGRFTYCARQVALRFLADSQR
jgi:hypothetical protein